MFLEQHWSLSCEAFMRAHPNDQVKKGHYQEFCAYSVGWVSNIQCKTCLSFVPTGFIPNQIPWAKATTLGKKRSGEELDNPNAAAKCKAATPSSPFNLKNFVRDERPGIYVWLRNNCKYQLKCLVCNTTFNCDRLTGRYRLDRHEQQVEHIDGVREIEAERQGKQNKIEENSALRQMCKGVDILSAPLDAFLFAEARCAMFHDVTLPLSTSIHSNPFKRCSPHFNPFKYVKCFLYFCPAPNPS